MTQGTHTLSGWDGMVGGRETEGDRIYAYLWLVHVDYDKNQHSIVKQLSFN